MPALRQGQIVRRLSAAGPACDQCGLDYGFADSGDGPAVLVTLLAGFLVVGLALWVEVAYEPPFWVHLVIFFPLTILVCLGLLRPLKSFMVAAQFHHKAEEGRLKD